MEFYKIQTKKVLKSLGVIFMVLSAYTLFCIIAYSISDGDIYDSDYNFFLPYSIHFAYFIGSIILFTIGCALFIIGNSLYES
ncbi:MAG: hypothetical protein ACFE9T_00910 [Promethearchaeota archaeon]